MFFYASKNLQHDLPFRSEILCRSGIMLYLIAALGKKYNIGQCQLAGLADLPVSPVSLTLQTLPASFIQNN